MKSLQCILPLLAMLATAVCSAPVLPTPTGGVEVTAALGRAVDSSDEVAREAGGVSDARPAGDATVTTVDTSNPDLRYMGKSRPLGLAISDYVRVNLSAALPKVQARKIKTKKTKTTTPSSTTSTVATTIVSTGTTTLNNVTPPVTSTYTTTYPTTYTTVVRSAAGLSMELGALQKAALFASLILAAAFGMA